MIRRPPRSTPLYSSAASDVYKRQEQTGWNLIYLHIAANERIRLGSWLNTGDRIGHPSREGGISSGTHLHMARKYNGEWVPAEGPLSFDLGGWKAKAGIN